MHANYIQGYRAHDIMVVQSVIITTKVESSNPTHGEVYNIMW